MSIVTYPLNGIVYDADDVATYLCTRTSGVYSRENNFSVSVVGAREVVVSPGLAWMNYDDFKGISICSREAIVLTVPNADASLDRIDRIVLQFDLDANLTALKVKTGTPAARPAPPEIVQTHHVYELGLATIAVPAGSVVISEINITDTRMDETVCGVMRDGVEAIPTDQLLAEARARINETMADLGLASDFVGATQQAARAAADSAGAAADSKAGAADSERNAASSASSAAASQAAAANSAGAAKASETNAATSATAANAAKTSAATSAATATEKANAASASAGAAKTSEDNAAESERVAAEYLEQVKTITTGAQGYYPTPEALRAAVPLGADGWWGVVGSTDTIWIWDSGTGAWVDSHDMTELGDYYTRGQVDSKVAGAKTVSYTISVPASGWAGGAAPYTNTVAVAGVTANTALSVITLEPSLVGNAAAETAMQAWSYLDTQAGAVVLYSDSKPTADFVIIAKEVK